MRLKIPHAFTPNLLVAGLSTLQALMQHEPLQFEGVALPFSGSALFTQRQAASAGSSMDCAASLRSALDPGKQPAHYGAAHRRHAR